MPIRAQELKQFAGPLFIETGAWDGEGVAEALNAGFEKVISIEAGEGKYQHCVKRFQNDPRVMMVYGTSQDQLWHVIKDITIPVVVYLDAHYCGDTGYGSCALGSPVSEELAILARHPIRCHTILIDDMRCFKDGDWMFDEFLKDEAVEALEAKIRQINPDYTISYLDGRFPDKFNNPTVFLEDVLMAQVLADCAGPEGKVAKLATAAR